MEARLALRSGAKERAGSLLKRALAAGGGAATDWLGVGEIRLALGDTEGAAAALDSVAAYRSNLLGSPACLRLRSEVLSRQGRDLAALEVFKQYRSIKDSLEMQARWSNAKYINERHQHELALEKYRGTLMFVFAGIVLLVVVIVGIAIVLKRTKDEQILLNRTEERARLSITTGTTEPPTTRSARFIIWEIPICAPTITSRPSEPSSRRRSMPTG